MKKFRFYVFAFMFVLAGLALAMPSLLQLQFAYGVEEDVIEIKGSTNDDLKSAFKNTFANPENYSKDIKLLGDIDFGGDEIDLSAYAFSGSFDGDGHTLKNFVITSQNTNFGLFSTVKGTPQKKAVIKNLKLEGTQTENEYNFEFNIPQQRQQLNVGVLIGSGENVEITNCVVTGAQQKIEENSVQNLVQKKAQIFSSEQDEQKIFDSSAKITFGGLVGSLSNGSKVENSVVYLQSTFNSTLQGTPDSRGVVQVGGLIGNMADSTMNNCASFADFKFATQSTYMDFYAGGLVGELSSLSVQYNTMQNSFFSGTLQSDENADQLVAGSLIGRLPLEYGLEKITYNHWINGLDAIGKTSAQSQLPNSNSSLRSVDKTVLKALSWEPLSDGWNFDTVWHWDVNGNLTLQKFMKFTFSISTQLASVWDSSNCKLLVNDSLLESHEYSYGEPVQIQAVYTDENKDYFKLDYVMKNSARLDKSYYSQVQNEDKEYVITITSANDMTFGEYSFYAIEKEFKYQVKVADGQESMGGVRASSTAQDKSELSPQTVRKGGKQQTLEGVGHGIYSFDYWKIQVWDKETGDYVFIKSNENDELQITTNPLTFNFGANDEDTFNAQLFSDDEHPFILIAYFTDEEALEISFEGYSGNVLAEVWLNGQLYEGKDNPVRVSPNVTIPLVVKVKKGYEFDVDQFVKFFSANDNERYGGHDTTSLASNYSQVEDEETGDMVYTFTSLNMSNIKDYLGESRKTFTIQLHTKLVEQDKENDLTWLWILLGVLGGVAIIATALAIYLVKRRNVQKRLLGENGTSKTQTKVKKTKEKKVNYRDYYN